MRLETQFPSTCLWLNWTKTGECIQYAHVSPTKKRPRAEAASYFHFWEDDETMLMLTLTLLIF